ncbi:MAG: hypothetical protein P857_640 [Candidatus Xenolissoclinum pacificiensis L6]|uniref:Transposase Synechocystis PCC 6803 domain-containing protein n=1 Tax=Candidatus Xenolissoclinum pacificiensis L6 TaxID=1401685 RepID=W2V128_9RICK|nr:MAG: hypothetical protein P857_640 [Candidatus Xenolissoclinum pacificiensis L6]
MVPCKEEHGLSIEKVEKHFGIQTIYNWRKKLEQKDFREQKSSKINMGNLEINVKKYPDYYRYEKSYHH